MADTGNIGGGSPSGGSSTGGGTNALQDLIPRGIRHKMLPFVLNKTDSGKPQIFSFKKLEGELATTCASGRINILPNDHHEMNYDISLRTLASQFGTNGDVSLETILGNLPAIQIREYVQDTRLQLFTGLLNNLIEGVNSGEVAASGSNGVSLRDRVNSTLKELGGIVKGVGTEICSVSFWKNLISATKTVMSHGLTNVYNSEDTDVKLILHLVYCLYYRMMDSKTTNIYTLPCNAEQQLTSSGGDGWGGHGGIKNFSTSGESAFGKIFNALFSHNVKIITQPIWEGNTNTSGESVSVTVKLFNDTSASALNNFVFVNTIIPQNMWLQYGIFQLPPSVYDIKIDGGQRFFMCSGSFSCRNMGVLRNPPESFIKSLINTYGNNQIGITEKVSDYFIKNRLIKIPDVYEISLNFNSLLPSNFNQYLYRFAANSIITDISGFSSQEQAFYNDNMFKEKTKETIKKAVEIGKKAAEESSSPKDVAKNVESAVQEANTEGK